MKVKVRAKGHIQAEGGPYQPGDVLEVPVADAYQLAAAGAIELEPVIDPKVGCDEEAEASEKKSSG